MRQLFRIRVLGAVAGLLSAAVACGGSNSNTAPDGGAPYGGPPAGGPPAGAPTMMIATNPTLGHYLGDGNGRSLYYYAKDFPAARSTGAVPNCTTTAAVLGLWPVVHPSSGRAQAS